MDNEFQPLLKNLALLLGGVMLGVAGRELLATLPFGSHRRIILILLFSAALGFILWGADFFIMAHGAFRRFCRWGRFRPPLVAILTSLSSSDKGNISGVGTDIPPSVWGEELRKVSGERQAPIRIRLVPADQIHDGYAAIINPFGSTYPESSFDNFPVYKSFLRFIRGGGLFVNVADLPTYFAFNPLLQRSIDRIPGVYTTSGGPLRFFSQIPLLEELAVNAWNCESQTPTTMAFRLNSDFASCGPPIFSLTPTRLVTIGDDANIRVVLEEVFNGQRVTPLWLSKYGNGHVLASISFLQDPYVGNRVLVPLLANIIVQQVIK